jgi:hypothetical protein
MERTFRDRRVFSPDKETLCLRYAQADMRKQAN